MAEVRGRMVLVDGWHRLAALQRLGRTTARVVVISREATPEEARWQAAEANLRHGRPLTRAELREAFQALVAAGHHRKPWEAGRKFLSYREISAALPGVAHTTIRNWMQADYPRIAKAMAGEGGDDAEAERPCKDPEAALTATTLDLIKQVAMGTQGLTDPRFRGAVVEALGSGLNCTSR